MHPLTLFLDIVAVGVGLVADGLLLGGLVLAGIYVLGFIRDAPEETE